MDARDEALTVANEFTTVEVRKVRTRNGERLEIRSTKLGYAVWLDPLALESLTWQPATTFSRLLEQPYGPDDEDTTIRPLTELMARAEGDGPAAG